MSVEVFATVPLLVILAALALTDVLTHRLPDAGTIPIGVFGLIVAIASPAGDLFESLLAAAAGYGLFWGVGAAFYRLRGYEGLGLGDAKLFGAAGAWVGLAGLAWVLLVATLMALIYVQAMGARRDTRVAFGPWLCIGFCAVWVGKLIG
ncbi:Type 4 prepilin-like proteins leader peptide-processing enzyme [Roseivivax jejudonensis]|uniref:Type 4 prepilin-like proteins leader peptide-processing enzyme n=1 Tax=Roseivivax jejudonensis TaxID=1529041 RepID=A0A1X6Y7R2_9RHOB|nr:A24 family peptidase [Roseivivax jejudonensis]SLN13262.1 Type 4 prepilin-like proteins leader peptide-processing enzyme [Roseivivax jejudonensis]